MRILILTITVILQTISLSDAFAQGCGPKDPDNSVGLESLMKEKVRPFMKTSGLIGQEEEQIKVIKLGGVPFLERGKKWRLIKIVASSGRCLFVTALEQFTRIIDKNETTWENDPVAWNVVQSQPFSNDPQLGLYAYPIQGEQRPVSVVVAEIYNPSRPNSPGFVAEFRSDSAMNVLKASEAGIEHSGFAGLVIEGASDRELKFIPNRYWHVEDAEYTLLKTNRTEVEDIYADQLDNKFSFYFAGALKSKTSSGKTGAHVAPWNNAVRKILEVK